MKKKIVALCLVICLAATAIVGASLAYFTDEATAENIMTTGTVDIELEELERVSDTNLDLVEFTQGKKLLPYTGVNEEGEIEPGILACNYVDKIVNVVNTGDEDAYVAVMVAVPAALDADTQIGKALTLNFNTAANWKQYIDQRQVQIPGEGNDTTVYNVYILYYDTILTPAETTATPAMYGMYLHPLVDKDARGNYTLDGEVIGFNIADTHIHVAGLAVQADGMAAAGNDKAESAIGVAFGDRLPQGWVEYQEPQM